MHAWRAYKREGEIAMSWQVFASSPIEATRERFCGRMGFWTKQCAVAVSSQIPTLKIAINTADHSHVRLNGKGSHVCYILTIPTRAGGVMQPISLRSWV